MLRSLDLPSYLRTQQEMINRELERSVPLDSESLSQSMRYSLLAGGKRIRPIICLTVCEAAGGSAEVAMPTAVALEMLHTATLIHDDLPAMDNDDYRRGKLTNHKVFGEGMALLAGDALLSYSLEHVLLKTEAPADRLLRVMHVLLSAIGMRGAIGGQVIDIQIEDRDDVDLSTLESMHLQKTGALLVAAVVTGAILADIDDDMIRRISRYGERIGLAFQIVDDILDVTSTLEQLGKTPNKDEKMRKATFPRLLGVEKSRQRALELVDAAKDEVKPLGDGAVPLLAIADYIVARSS
jgi:geranylgeranyl diphosphate synthase, type II